jgi:Phage integrase, N-terminal SAM-like domain
MTALSTPSGAPPKLIPTVRRALRVRHYSHRTEEAYVGWVRRFVRFHDLRHPAELGEREIAEFLTHLATGAGVAASTQTQALSALLFLYRDILERPFEELQGIARAKRPERVPVVLSRVEIKMVLGCLSGVPGLWQGCSMAPDFGCSRASSYGSKTLTSSGARSPSGAARAGKTG